VGDSRLYLWRKGQLTQLTEDHSWVNEQVRAGILSEIDARSHQWRHVVTRALSGGDDPQVDVAEMDIQKGDRLLLCSDGLSGVVGLDKIGEILGNTGPLDDACRALVDAANLAGGPDNITAAILQVDAA
jgi:serine/threonine protein phosphatase PrpC